MNKLTLLVDYTGIKFLGDGAWQVRKPGTGLRLSGGIQRPHNAIHFRPSTLDLPLLTADPYLNELMAPLCEMILNTEQKIALSTRDETHVLKQSRIGWPKQEDVARYFGMSRRSFARRLSDEGTSFRALTEGLREALGRSLVIGTDLQLTAIASKLGYRNASTFSTAFRRWNGVSPRQLRSTSHGTVGAA